MHFLLQLRICYSLAQTPITSQTIHYKMATTHNISIDSKAYYHISEKLKEVETGIDYGKGLSLNYKKEIGEYLLSKYL